MHVVRVNAYSPPRTIYLQSLFISTYQPHFWNPLASPYLAINTWVSVALRFLQSAGVYETPRTVVTVDAPGIRFFGVITEATSIGDRSAWSKLDQLPDQPIPLLPTSLRFEGRRPATRRPAPETTYRRFNRHGSICFIDASYGQIS